MRENEWAVARAAGQLSSRPLGSASPKWRDRFPVGGVTVLSATTSGSGEPVEAQDAAALASSPQCDGFPICYNATRRPNGEYRIQVDQPVRETGEAWGIWVSSARDLEGKGALQAISDSSAGGKRKALKKALELRAELEKELGKPRTERIIRSKSKSRKGSRSRS